MTDVSKAAVEGLKHLRKPIDLKSMTKADARVAIAKDVLAALDAKKITASAGTYGVLDLKNPVRDFSVGVREILPDLKHCNVCALGAAAIALVGRENHLAVNTYPGVTEIRLDDYHYRSLLREYFSGEQLAMIESAFESANYAHKENLSYQNEGILNSVYYSKHIPNGNVSSVRMRAIFQNIIDNNGTFVP